MTTSQIVDCPDCTSGGIITWQQCSTCNECRWIETTSQIGAETVEPDYNTTMHIAVERLVLS